jgi:drug/metabolite transporter (DMT)-like permease
VPSPDSGRLRLAFVVLTLIWGSTWAVIRLGLEGVPPLTGVALRFALAGAILLALASRLGVRFTWSREELGLWAMNGLLAFSVSYTIVYWAEQHIPSGLTALLFATYPLFVAVLAHLFLPGERPGWSSAAGILLGFVGVGVIFSDDLELLGGANVREVALVLLLSPFVSALATVAVKRWGAGIHPLSLTAVPMLMTAGVVGTLAFVFERHARVVFDLRSVGAIVYLAVFGSAVTFTIYYWMLARARATQVALIAYTIPIVAVAVGALLFQEPIRPRVILGGVVVLIGVAIVSRRR